jgi:hypothetical protein
MLWRFRLWRAGSKSHNWTLWRAISTAWSLYCRGHRSPASAIRADQDGADYPRRDRRAEIAERRRADRTTAQAPARCCSKARFGPLLALAKAPALLTRGQCPKARNGAASKIPSPRGTEGSNPASSSGESCANHGLRGRPSHTGAYRSRSGDTGLFVSHNGGARWERIGAATHFPSWEAVW